MARRGRKNTAMTTSVKQHGSRFDSGPPKPGAGEQMVQSLGLFSATTIVVGSMIGSGIFIVDAISRG